MLIYATPDDLARWDSSLTLPADAPQLLRSASIIVARAINESLHAAGAATSDERRDATCAQVVSWLASGIRPGGGGLFTDRVLKARDMGGTKFEYDTNRTASAEVLTKRGQIAEDLAPEAAAILQAAGLLWAPVATVTGARPEIVALGTETPVRCGPLDWWRS